MRVRAEWVDGKIAKNGFDYEANHHKSHRQVFPAIMESHKYMKRMQCRWVRGASVRPMTMRLVSLARVRLSAKLMARDEHKLFPFPFTPSAHGAEWIKYFLERLLSVALSPLQVKLNFPFALSSPLTFHPKILVQIFYCLRWARGKKDFRLRIQFHFKFLLAKRKVAVPRPIPPSTGSCFMHVRQYVLRAFEGLSSRYNRVGGKFTNFDWIGWRKASESI